MASIRFKILVKYIHAATITVVLLSSTVGGCWYYSFNQATIPSHLQSIAIPLAEDNSISPVTALDQALTELLIDRFVRQTRLVLVENEEDADIILTAQISQYRNVPTAVTGEERAQFNRITLSVSAQYHNRVDDETLRRSFSNFDDYDPLEGGLEAEEGAALAALENIADDLFTAATSNW